MRTWANLSVGLRHSSLASTPGGNVSAHYSGSFSNKKFLCYGDLLRTLVRGTPHAEAIHREFPHNRRLACQQHGRPFSSTPRSRIKLEDDEDEEDAPSKPQKPARRVVGRPPPPVQSMDMRTLILSRKPKTPQPKSAARSKSPKAPEPRPPLTPQQLHELTATENELNSFDQSYLLDQVVNARHMDAEYYLASIIFITRQISSAIGQILYDHDQTISSLVGRSKTRCLKFENEFCQLVYHRTPEWTKAVSESRKKISEWEREFVYVSLRYIAKSVRDSKHWINEMQRLIKSQYLEPRKSARDNIDKLLAESELVSVHYNELQSKGRAVLSSLDDILSLVSSLKVFDLMLPIHGIHGFEDFQILLAEHRMQFGWAAHAYRSAWAERKRTEVPFKDAYFWSAKDFTDVLRSVKHRDESSVEVARRRMFVDILRGPREKALFKREKVVVGHLCGLYLPKWTERREIESGDSLLDITWRQLNVMAPFEIKLVQDWWLQEEVLFLQRSLDQHNSPFGPMWTKVDPEIGGQLREKLKVFLFNYVRSRKAFAEDIRVYKHINWHRLKIEEKLHKLGEPNDIQLRGLFVATRPISLSKSRLYDWAKLYSAIGFKAWVLRKLNILPMETITNELGETTTQYARLSNTFLKSVQAPFVPEGGTVISAKGNRALPRERRSISRRKRPVMPVFKRKFGEPPFDPKATEPPTPSDDRTQSSSAPAPMDSPFPIKPNPGLDPARLARAWLSQKGLKKKKPSKETIQKMRDAKKPGLRRLRAYRLKLIRSQMNSTDSIVSGHETKKPATAQQLKPKWKPNSKPKSSPVISGNVVNSKTPILKNNNVASPSESEPSPRLTTKSSHSTEKQHQKPDTTTSSCQKPIPQSSMDADMHPKYPGTFSKGTSPMNAQPNGKRSYSSSASSNNFKSSIIEEHPDETGKHSLPLGVLPTAEITDDSTGIESKAKSAEAAAPLFWSHSAQRGPSGQKLMVHYCRTLKSSEEIAQLFLNSKVLGFDMEWKAQASSWDSIQSNVSLIQIANEERIALFQVSLFKPAKTRKDFVAPSLQKIIESPDITKVGVSIKGDATRLRKFLGVEARSIFELSHLFKLVKYGQTNPKLVNKRGVNLSDQVEEHFGLPLEKSDDVRCGDWTVPLNYRQVQYAATDPYACVCLFNIMEQKRQAMDPLPPLPACAELNLPIVLPRGQTVNSQNQEPAASALDKAAKVDGS